MTDNLCAEDEGDEAAKEEDEVLDPEVPATDKITGGVQANAGDQAKLFEEKIGSPSKILYLCVNDVILKERLVKRSNFDDQPDAINKRIETFNKQTKEVTKKYANLVSTVSILFSLPPYPYQTCKSS